MEPGGATQANDILSKIQRRLEAFFSTIDDVFDAQEHLKSGFDNRGSAAEEQRRQAQDAKRESDASLASGGARGAGHPPRGSEGGVLQPVFPMDALSAVGSEGDVFKPLAASQQQSTASVRTLLAASHPPSCKKQSDASFAPTDDVGSLSMFRKTSTESEQQQQQQLHERCILHALHVLRNDCCALFPHSTMFQPKATQASCDNTCPPVDGCHVNAHGTTSATTATPLEPPGTPRACAAHFVRLMQLPSESQQDMRNLLASPPPQPNSQAQQQSLSDDVDPTTAALPAGTSENPQFSELLISVSHPECVASSLLVSFAWDSSNGGAIGVSVREGEEDVGCAQEKVDVEKSSDEDTASPTVGTPKPPSDSGAQAVQLQPHPPQRPMGKAPLVGFTGGSVRSPSPSTASGRPRPTSAATMFQPDSVFQLTPIINNNYVLLGGLGSFKWHPHGNAARSSDGGGRRLGTGGGGLTMHEEVLLAYSLKHQHAVVVKVIRPEQMGAAKLAVEDGEATTTTIAASSTSSRRLRQARRAAMVEDLKRLTALRHPHLITLFDVFDEPSRDCAYLVYQHCDAGCIRLTVERNRTSVHPGDEVACRPSSARNPTNDSSNDGGGSDGSHQRQTKFLPRQVATYLAGVLDALSYLHANGVVHGNVCIDNLLVDRSGAIFLGGAALPEECSRHHHHRKQVADRTTPPPLPHPPAGIDACDEAAPAEDFADDVASLAQSFQELWPSLMRNHRSAGATPSVAAGVGPPLDGRRCHDELWAALGDLVASMSTPAINHHHDRDGDTSNRRPPLAGAYLEKLQHILATHEPVRQS